MHTLRIIITSLLIVSVIQVNAQFEGAKEIYEAPKMKETIATHKTVSILPFDAKITYKRVPKNYDAKANEEEEKSLASSLQSSMYTFLLRKNDNYTCAFQDPTKTNALLKRAGVFDRLDEMTQDSICKILGVDAVILGKYEYEKTASEGGAIVKTFLFGGLGSKTGSGTLTLQIYNGADGNLLWRFYKALPDTVFSSTDQVIEHMMRKVSRNFPYDK